MALAGVCPCHILDEQSDSPEAPMTNLSGSGPGPLKEARVLGETRLSAQHPAWLLLRHSVEPLIKSQREALPHLATVTPECQASEVPQLEGIEIFMQT
jgi:hypothetical protein